MSCTAQRGSPYGMESYTAGYPIPLGPVDSDGLQRRRHPLQLRGRVGGDRQAPALVTHRCIARCKAPPVRGMQLSGAATFGLREHAALRCNLACWRRSGPSRNFATASCAGSTPSVSEVCFFPMLCGPSATARCISGWAAAAAWPILAAEAAGGLTPDRSAPGLGSPLPQLPRDWANVSLSHLHRNWAHPSSRMCTRTGSSLELGLQPSVCARGAVPPVRVPWLRPERGSDRCWQAPGAPNRPLSHRNNPAPM